MFRDKRPAKGPAVRGRGTASKFTRGAANLSSGKVGKTFATKGLADKKLKSLKLRLADRGIQFDPNYQLKKQKLQTTKALAAVKTEKTLDVPLYRQKMAITPDPERKCVDDEILKIQEALLDALEPLEDGCFPQFFGSYSVKGTLVMSCANEQSKQWLEKTVPQLTPWEGAKLCIKPRGELAQGTKVLLKTPKLFAKTDPKKILQMLSTQNKTLQTNMWKNVSVKTESSGQTLTYIVDNKSLEDIKALDNKVYLGLGNVELVIVKEGEEEEDNKETS